MPLSIKIGMNVAGMGGSSFSPLSYSPVLWLKADGGTYQDTGTATPAATDTDPVGGWRDQSAAGNHLAQATAAKRPLLKLAIKNGLPVVRTDGLTQYLAGGAFARPAGTTVWLALSFAWALNKNVMDSAPGGGVAQLYMQTATPRLTMFGTQNGPTTTGLAAGTFGILECHFNGASSRLTVNGGSDNTGDPGTVTQAGLTLGVGSNGTSGPSALDLGEVLVFTSVLAAGDRAAVRNYLNGRWAAY